MIFNPHVVRLNIQKLRKIQKTGFLSFPMFGSNWSEKDKLSYI